MPPKCPHCNAPLIDPSSGYIVLTLQLRNPQTGEVYNVCPACRTIVPSPK